MGQTASDFDGAAAEGAAYRDKFTGKYSRRIFKGIGHNVPQQAPQAFAQAVVDVGGRGHSLTIDSGWRAVAEVALASIAEHAQKNP